MRVSFFLKLYLDMIWYVNMENLDYFSGGYKWVIVQLSLCCQASHWTWVGLSMTGDHLSYGLRQRLAVFKFKQFVKRLCDFFFFIPTVGFHFLMIFFYFILFLNFTILYWFCQILKWIRHTYTCVPHPEPSSLLPPHTIPLGCPSAPAPSIQYRASNLDWRLVSYMILYVFQCHETLMMFYNPILDTVVLEKISKCLPYLIFSYNISSVVLLSLSLNLVNPTGKENIYIYIYREREERKLKVKKCTFSLYFTSSL